MGMLCSWFFPGKKNSFLDGERYTDKICTNLSLQEITSNGQGMFILKLKNEEDLIKKVEEPGW